MPWLLKAGHSPREADEWASQFASWADAKPSHVDLFSKVFAEKWRMHSRNNSLAWVGRHAALTEHWANYRLGSRADRAT